MRFSDKIKQILDKQKITQQELANNLGVSFATVNRWVKGHITPREDTSLFIDEYCRKNNIILDENDTPNLFVGFNLISASNLEYWFANNKRDSQGLFPQLIEKLSLESCNKPFEYCYFPSKDKVNTDGFDGEIISNELNNYFIPYGNSVWELGATILDSSGKIKEDYYKRTENTSPTQKQISTFILVTPKTFSYNKKNTLKTEFLKGGWKEVKIYDGIIIEQWLSQCLNTSLWLYKKMTKCDIEMQTFDIALNEFESRTTPQLPSSIFTNGRKDAVNKLIELCNNSNTIKISSPSFEESYGFVLSAFAECNDANLWSKIIICNDIKTLKDMDAHSKNKIFILNTPIENFSFISQNKCILLFGKNDFKNNIDIRLENRPQSVIFEAIKTLDIPEKKLIEIKHKAKNNIMLLMRELANEHYFLKNKWIQDSNLFKLIPLLMVGKINQKNNQDLNLMKLFTDKNISMEEYISYFLTWENLDNTPISIKGEIISVILKEELWYALAPQIPQQTISTLKQCIVDIFKDENPKYSLPIKDQPASQIFGKNWKYSKYIIENLLESCIMLAVYNNKQLEMDIMVRSILSEIKNKEHIFTIADYFVLFAELSPNEFLTYCEQQIKSHNDVFYSLFENSQAPAFFSGGHEYCNLLFALELLLSLNDYKFRACDVLIKLYLQNFSYNISNSPYDTLEKNLHWLNNHNALSFEDKKRLIIKYIKLYGEKFYQLPINLISKNTIFFSGVGTRCRIPDIKNETITWGMIYEANENYISTILNNLDRPDNIILQKICNQYPYLTKKMLDKITEYIEKFFIKNSEAANNAYEYFIEKISFLNKYAKNDDYSNFYNFCNNMILKLTPTDYLKKNIGLFKNFSCWKLNQKAQSDWQKEDEKIFNKQYAVFNKLYKTYNIKTLIKEILDVIPNNGFDGYFFSQLTLQKNEIIEFLTVAKQNKKYNFLVSFIENSNVLNAKQYFNEQSIEFIEELMPNLKYIKEVPEIILENSKLIQLFYKQREFSPDLDNMEKELVKLYNPISYIRYILYNVKEEEWDVNEIIKALNNINQENVHNANNYYYLKEIITKLDKNYDSQDILKIEFNFFNIFNFDEIPNGIRRYLFNNPLEYIQIMTSNINENKNLVNIWFKLYSYMSFPNDFNVFPEKSNAFINTLLNHEYENENESKLLKSNLGSILARSYKHDKELFIPIPLKELLEKIADEDVNTGVILGYENMRGVRTISDGTPELELAKKYEQEATDCNIQYIQAANILRKIAENRKFDANMDKIERMTIDGLL